MTDLDRQSWRNQVTEAVLEPDLPILDSHHHLVPVPPRPRLERYLPQNLFADLESGHTVLATVHVEAFSNYLTTGPEHLRVVGETEYVNGVAEEALRSGAKRRGACAAIVVNADLMMGAAVGEVLDAHLGTSPRVRGVRRMTIYDPDLPTFLPGHFAPGLLVQPIFREGMREVVKRGLSFDAAILQSQFPDLLNLARAFPDAKIILNHIGTPLSIGRYAGHEQEAFAEWHSGITELARCPNVLVKIGGLNMPFTGLGAGDCATQPLTSAQLADRQHRHVSTTIDLFGPRRCMFESNSPVDGWYSSYTVLWNGFKRMAAGYSREEKAALFYETAARAYRIDLRSVAIAAATRRPHAS